MIIAGFGRWQIAGRVLLSGGEDGDPDHDPDRVDTLQFDMKVFYGDATRVICWSLRGGKAEVLINAIDDPQVSLQLVELAKEHHASADSLPRPRCGSLYPAASGRRGGPGARLRGAALKSGRTALEALGLGAYEARERAGPVSSLQPENGGEMVAMAENDAASPGGL